MTIISELQEKLATAEQKIEDMNIAMNQKIDQEVQTYVDGEDEKILRQREFQQTLLKYR